MSQTDAKGQTSTFSYDKLGRMTQRAEPDMTSAWTYDTAAHGIGKLASTSITAGSGAGYQRSYSYDGLSRPVQVATTIDGAVYHFATSYDAAGRLSTVTYPSSLVLNYSYTSLGYAQQISGPGSQVFWTANARDAELHLTQQTTGNGIVTVQSYDPPTGRLTNISAGTGNSVENLSYSYDAVGNLLSRTDTNESLSETFVYDTLNRLTSATANLSPTPLTKTFSYDAIGNLLSKSDVGTYTYPAAGQPQPHAVASIAGGTINSTFTYDANGNQTAGLGRTIGYASFNKPSTITQGTSTLTFSHDPDHQRFKQVAPEGTTLYFDAFGVHAELFVSGTSQWNDYFSTGENILGLRVLHADNSVTGRYFHTDHLGSIAVITDPTGAVVERDSYDAWGKRRFPTGADDPSGSITSQTTHGFTDEEELTDVGLIHMNGRVYDPRLGKFTSVDPLIVNSRNIQTFNAYSYALNNPLVNTDPSGMGVPCDNCGQENSDRGEGDTVEAPAPSTSDVPISVINNGGDNPSAPGLAPSGNGPASGDNGAGDPNATTRTSPTGTATNGPGVSPFNQATEIPQINVTAPRADRPHRSGTGDGGEGNGCCGSGWSPVGRAGAGGWGNGLPPLILIGSTLRMMPWEGGGGWGTNRTYGPPGSGGYFGVRPFGVSPGTRGGDIAPPPLKPINLPAWRKVDIDMAHVLERHTVGGPLSAGRDTFPEFMSEKAIERAIRQAYRYGSKIDTQGDRVLMRGSSDRLTIEMWLNRATRTIETAYPVGP